MKRIKTYNLIMKRLIYYFNETYDDLITAINDNIHKKHGSFIKNFDIVLLWNGNVIDEHNFYTMYPHFENDEIIYLIKNIEYNDLLYEQQKKEIPMDINDSERCDGAKLEEMKAHLDAKIKRCKMSTARGLFGGKNLKKYIVVSKH